MVLKTEHIRFKDEISIHLYRNVWLSYVARKCQLCGHSMENVKYEKNKKN